MANLEEWLYQHNMRLGLMTHSLQAIAQENANLTQQRKNNEELQTTLRVGMRMTMIIDYDDDNDDNDE